MAFDWPEGIKKLQEFCGKLTPIREAAVQLYEQALKAFNEEVAAFRKAEQQKSCQEVELVLLRKLKDLIQKRHAAEPRHSHPDHDHCEECEILADLALLRRSAL